MRVIGGSLKGKKLLIPLDKSTRPLRDMGRESIFNILDHSSKVPKNINNSKVLDLFSGTGSFGIECLSCLLYTSPSPRDKRQSRMPSSA